jgi:hypothetical protein
MTPEPDELRTASTLLALAILYNATPESAKRHLKDEPDRKRALCGVAPGTDFVTRLSLGPETRKDICRICLQMDAALTEKRQDRALIARA